MIPESVYNIPVNKVPTADRSRSPSSTGSHDLVEDEELDGQILVDLPPLPDDNARHSILVNPPHGRQSSRQSRKDACTTSCPSTPLALTKPRDAGKVQKASQRCRNTISPRRIMWMAIDGSQTPDPKKALRYLSQVYKDQEQMQIEVQTWQAARDIEIQDLETISQALHGQLQQSEQQVIALTRELAQHHERVPKWQDRIKRLGDFVKGLSHDHTRLRDDAKAMNEELKQLHTFKETVKREVQAATIGLQDERAQHQSRLSKARHLAESLQQALNARSLEMKNEKDRLVSEQGRHERLEQSLANSAAQHQELIVKLGHQEDNMVSRFDSLSKTLHSLHINFSANNQDYLQMEMQECLSLLKRPQEPISLDPASMEKLGTSMREIVDK